MHKFSFEEKLQKILVVLQKKDKITYEALMSKAEEVINCEDVNHYKNLRAPLQQFKRVHINKNFVLTFKYTPAEDKIEFFDFDHHDNIYKRKSKKSAAISSLRL